VNGNITATSDSRKYEAAESVLLDELIGLILKEQSYE